MDMEAEGHGRFREEVWPSNAEPFQGPDQDYNLGLLLGQIHPVLSTISMMFHV